MHTLRAAFIMTAFCLADPVYATSPFGFNSQTFRGRIAGDVGAHQWNPSPLFTLLIQSSNDQWGFDVVQGTTEFAPMDATGRPSQSGWHDHPTALSIGLVIQGTVWSHEANNLSCVRAIPTGSVFFERSGEIHNNYNLDPSTPAVVRVIHFVDRNQAATRRDQPDPVTGSATTASPPPPPCPADAPAASSSPGLPANPRAVAVGMNSFPPPVRHHSLPPAVAHRRHGQDGAE
jgi:quercetin dioxygenase-like cupin family protein